MAKHRLVILGDSLAQGFLNGAIRFPRQSYAGWVAQALGIRDFRHPIFGGPAGLPLDLEWLLRKLAGHFGERISRWELPAATAMVRQWLDQVEDYWERGDGSKPVAGTTLNHNLANWGYEIGDALELTASMCDRVIPVPKDDWLSQVPEQAFFRTARRVLNPSGRPIWNDLSACDVARELGRDGGVENLVVMLGANHALGTMTRLRIRWSTDDDLHDVRSSRANLYRPEHFDRLFDRLTEAIEAVGAERVFVGTIPHVTIPPVARGVGREQDGYYTHYTRPWIWDSDFDPERHTFIAAEEARSIDGVIDHYNDTIERTVEKHANWHRVDVAATLDRLAFRRRDGKIVYPFPPAMVDAFRRDARVNYLVQDNDIAIDTRYLRTREVNGKAQLIQGGLFSLDGMHPTITGYALVGQLLLDSLIEAGAEAERDEIDWAGVIDADTLVHDPPRLLNDLQAMLRFLDRRGLLSAVLSLF